MSTTTNYNFNKPAGTEFFNIVHQNDNWDLADAALKALEDGKVGKEIITAANDFIVGAGTAAVAKKTLAQTKTILGVDAATESAKGVVELATAAETTAGSDATRAVHPAGLKVELDKKVNKAGDTMTGVLKFNKGINARSYKEVLHYTNPDVVSGTLKITLPKSWSDTMLIGKIKGFQYEANKSWELDFAGYNLLGSTAWLATTAKVNGQCPFTKVRFAYDGTKCCLLIGDLATSWSFPTIAITEFLASLTNVDGWETGWSASIITSETGLTNIVEAILVGTVPKETVITSGFSSGWSGVLKYSVTQEGLLLIAINGLTKTSDISAYDVFYTLPVELAEYVGSCTSIGLSSAGGIVSDTSVTIQLENNRQLIAMNHGSVTTNIRKAYQNTLVAKKL